MATAATAAVAAVKSSFNDSDEYNELTQTVLLFAEELTFKNIIKVLVEKSIYVTKSDISCLYLNKETVQHAVSGRQNNKFKSFYKRGNFRIPESFSANNVLIDFIMDCKRGGDSPKEKR